MSAHASSIGGALRWDHLAQLHRPSDPLKIAREVHRLHSEQNLTARDIADALRVDYTQVINILSFNPPNAS